MPLKKIKASDIASIKCFQLDAKAKKNNYGESRPVFKVTFSTGEILVVKAELAPSGLAEKKKSAVFGGLIMETVSPKVKFELLDPAEVTEIGKLHVDKFLPGDRKALVKDYLNDVAGTPTLFFMTKMDFVPELRSLASQLNPTNPKVVQKAQKLVARLSAPTALNLLGKVIAADLFNGNNDRFDKEGNLVNLGNVMFEKLGDKSYVPVGLDHLDPNSDVSNLAKAIDLSNWGGTNLAKSGEVAVRAIQSINAAIRKTFEEVGGEDAPPTLDQTACGGPLKGGIDEGANLIKNRLVPLANSGQAVPNGVIQRMKALKWLK